MTAKNKNDKPETKADVKSETKAEAKQPDAAPPPTTTETAIATSKPAALIRARRVKPARGLELMHKDPVEMDNAVSSAMGALVALATDPKLPTEYQKIVTELVNQASTDKPGMEEVVVGWKIPLITINQPTTTAAARPDTAKLGDIYTSEGRVLERPFPFLVFSLFQENVNFPQNAKVPVCTALDAQLGNAFGKCVECPHLPYGLQTAAEQKVTDCQNQITAIVATIDASKVYMVRFAKTSRKAGSALQSLAGASIRMWDNSFLLSTEKGQGAQAYFVFKVEPTGKPNNEHVRLIAQTLCNLYRAERDRALADHYRAVAAAPATAAAAEGAFEGSKLDAGLTGETESYDLGEGGGTPAAGSGSVRSAAKPM
jgi:hypothetical protein